MGDTFGVANIRKLAFVENLINWLEKAINSDRFHLQRPYGIGINWYFGLALARSSGVVALIDLIKKLLYL